VSKTSGAPWSKIVTALFRKETLANGLTITFTDMSTRYFGDYHRVCVVATIHCVLHELPLTNPEQEILHQKACKVIGDRLSIVKRFQRMGVPSAAVAEVRQSLVDDFMHNTYAYISRPDYPYCLLKAELNKPGKQKIHV
jgi:hypothetical protein